MTGVSAENRIVAIGVTGAGKAALLRQMLADYAEKHPLGSARQVARGLIFVEPGPDVIQGEVISRAREVEETPGTDA